jgi:hypothetical protein
LDIDMHYYGTYALARAAGIRADAARVIATAAQFVDDAIGSKEAIVHPDGARFRSETTSHHPFSLAGVIQNNNLDDQQLVWVPFHFLPGGDGDTQSQKLICRKDSKFAREMVRHHLVESSKFYGLELMGITAHVYADTFAHYGFSGVSSRVNRVVAASIRPQNAPDGTGMLDRFLKKFGVQNAFDNFCIRVSSMVATKWTTLDPAATGALGHGAVATFPDQPYLRWSYDYEMPAYSGMPCMSRNNAQDYEEGAAALHRMFRDFAAHDERFYSDWAGLDFEKDLRLRVRQIFAVEKPSQDRSDIWKAAVTAGQFTSKPGETIPPYDPMAWQTEIEELRFLPSAQDATSVPSYRFSRAAAAHRDYVLMELLPKMGVYII